MPSERHADFDTALPDSFYARSVQRVAADLLGCYLVLGSRSRFRGGRIVETEAYGGPGDPGSHAHRAPNGRARIMFGPPGRAYVYFTYGMHHCLNAVCDREGTAAAVLIRAVEPLWGTNAMRAGAPPMLGPHKVMSGPGRICRALQIDMRFNGADLTGGRLRILEGERPRERKRGPRVGLTVDDERPWRFWTDSPSVSR